MSGQAGSGGSGGSMGNISPTAIASLQKSLGQSTGPGMGAAPGMTQYDRSTGATGDSFAPGVAQNIAGPTQAAPVPNPIGQAAQQGSTAGLTAGLGAGDAAAAAAQASGAMLPGAASANVVSQMMQGIGDHNRAAIQQKIDMLKKIALSGG